MGLLEYVMERVILPLLGIFLLFAVLSLTVVIYKMATDHSEEDFMKECLAEHKNYECVAMWRAGESHTQVVPMPIVVPAGRR